MSDIVLSRKADVVLIILNVLFVLFVVDRRLAIQVAVSFHARFYLLPTTLIGHLKPERLLRDIFVKLGH